MKIKQLLRHTTILLRTALLLGAATFVNVQQATAQPVSLTADMPDAFETRTPVIGDGQYYYIQFYEELVYSPYLCCPFLGEAGNDGDNINAMDYMPFAPNRLWTLEEAGNGRFKLKSKRGNYIYLEGSNFKKTSSSTTASAFELIPKTNLRDGLTYYQLRVRDSVNLSREKGNLSNYEWATIISNPNNNAHNYVRFAQLKPNAAHIIYYRQEHNDGYDNSQYRANETTTRHYLTYSNTGNESPARDGDFYESAVSSRRSIVPSNKSLWTLPTAAAYHQDGLWALEDAGSEGEFYIKKYEGEEYVNYQPVNTTGYGLSVLGTKDSEFGRYKLERPINNRYTRIENVNKFDNSALASSMFYNWSGSSAAATQGTAASVDWHVGENVANGSTIAGAATVNYNVYADLTGSTKLVFNGTAGMVLRLIFNRLEEGKVYSNSLYTGNSDSHGGSYIQRFCTIGSDGIGELDVSDLPYVHLNAIKNWSIAGTVSSITLVKPETVLVAANQFYDWDGYGAGATPTQQETSSEFHLMMGSHLNQGDVVAGTGIVNYLAYADYTGYTKMILEGTPGTALRLLLNRPVSPLQPGDTGYDENGGTAVEKTATIGADGKAEVDLSDLSFVHLNAVKIGWGSSGAVTAIKVQKPSTSGNTIYMTHSKGDGWPAMQRNDDAGNHWYAAFYPVEVPVPNKDDFFQVRLGLYNNESKENINLNHGRNGDVNYSLLPGSTDENIIGATFTANDAWQNVFQYKDGDKLSVGNHQKLVVRFGSPVEGNWAISGIVYKNGAWSQGWVDIPQGSTIYEMNLYGFTDIEDLTVFSTGSVDSNHNRITIAECYFLDGQMINYNGGASTISDANPDVWQLEQIDDYEHFRVKNKATGCYLKPQGAGVTEPNDPTGADIFTNQKLFGGFATPKWFFISPAVKEIVVNGFVRHKVSYLRDYAKSSVIPDQEGLKKQGLSRDVDSDWKEFENKVTEKPFLLDGFIQKTNYFEITHYLKKGDSRVIEFPTVLNRNNDHIFFQRFYNFNEDDTQMDLDNLKAHVSLDTRDDGDVQYFLYKNGMVTGQKLDWTGIEDGGMARNEQRRFNFTNSDGKTFNVGIDVARYSDLEYKDETINNVDYHNLYEPSLTMRYLFYMNDAKEMAKKLTACPEGSGKWLEQKEFHFGRTQVPYTRFKKVGYRGEFIPIRHIFSDYWVYDDPQLINEGYLATLGLTGDALNDYLDQHLVSAVNDNNSGKIEVEVVPGNTGIRKGGYNPVLADSLTNGLNNEKYDDWSCKSKDNESNYQGFYFYDKLSPNPKTEYGNSRFVVFRYPKTDPDDPDSVVQVKNCGPENPAYINVYLNNGGTRYQLAQFKLIFDANMATRPWTQIKNGTHYANGTDSVKNTVRDPNQLRKKAGKPIAKVTFDYPIGNTYHYPSVFDANSTDGITKHNGGNNNPGGTIANSSPVPLTFGHTNYSFDGDGCNWGSYALVTQKRTQWGNNKTVLPADDKDFGYNIDADPGMQKAFMYIDASEQPGDICAVDFEGEFCANDQLMCTGWISGSNRIQGDTRCPGSITLTVKGEDEKGNSNTIYRFCPGQIYELDDGYQKTGGEKDSIAGIDGNGNGATHVVWQQFYFEFSTNQKYERYWLEVNNNCVSSNGGDFMLDNVEVYTIVPEVEPEINTPICVKRDANNNIVYDMRFLKLKVDYNKLKSSIIKKESTSSETTTDTPYLGIVFLEKEKFLRKLRTELRETDLSLEEMAERVENGYYDNTINGGTVAYQNAFKAALLRSSNTNENIWKSDDESPILGSGILYYKWDKTFESTLMPEYTFKDAVNKTSAVYRYTEEDEDYIILNGNFPELPWKTNTDYYIVPSNTVITTFGQVYEAFNICSNCSKASVFQIEPPYTVLGLESAETTSDYVVCEGQKPTMLLDLKGYDYNGDEIDMKDLNYDWWLGNATTKATLEYYHLQHKTIDSEDVYLDKALSALRAYYPNITSLDGVAVSTKTPNLTTPMVKYLRELVNAGELVLHQKSISVPAEAAGEEDPYFYIVACPIHDEMFKQALNSTGTYSAVKNGDMERKDVSSFYVGTPTSGGAKPATLTDGVGKNGSRGLSITSVEKAEGDPTDWDTQFFIKAKERIPIGTTFHLEFDYKASAAATVSTQAHAAPGSYNDWHMLGDLSFTTEWQHYSNDIEVLDVMGNGTNNDKDNSFQTIAFNLWKTRDARTYYFDNVVFTYPKKQYVSFYCDEPQGYRVKVGEKAPTLKTGFVPYENGFSTYNYPENSDPVLSIRLAKKEQFLEVQHGSVDDNPADTYNTSAEANKHFLWLPIRNAQTQTANGVIRKSADYNIYLSSTNDPTWDKNIYVAMRDGSLPIVGKIVQLKAINTTGNTNIDDQNDYNRLCVYFTENFDVREGYNYVLSLPFQEETDGEGNAVNACDGTILINLKIVPDYEVWTGGAGNTDWNNDENWRRADGNTSPKWNANDELYVAAAKNDSPLYGYKTNDWNYRTDNDRVLRKGFAPLYCTHILMKSDEWGNAPQLYDAIDKANNSTGQLQKSPFPNLRDEDGWDGTTGENATKATATPILRYDMQARLWDIWEETYGTNSIPKYLDDNNNSIVKGRSGDLLAEMYQINSCDGIAFQPGTELRYAHLLNYNNAWVEYQLDNKRWYLLGSPLQGTISGEWYAPTGTAKQETTYYDPVTFGTGYDRYSPAIYQRSWDKAKAVLYEVGATWNKDDDKQDANLGDDSQGLWSGSIWNNTGADDYLDRLGYKPMGNNKANVAIKGIWSNTYNDAQVDYATGGFSVMVMNHLKNNDQSGGRSIIRLPKEDTMYDYYKFSEDGSDNGGTDTYLIDHNNEQGVQNAKGRAKNRGRLKTDLLLPATVTASAKTVSIKKQEGTASIYGDQRDYTRIPIHEDALTAMNTALVSATFTEKVAAGATAAEAAAASTLNYYLVENPFACGLDMDKFFLENAAKLQKKYWLLTETGQHLVQKADDVEPSEWISPSGNDFATAHKVLAPGQGFFVEAQVAFAGDSIDIVFNKDMQVQSRYGVKSGTGRTFEIEVGREQVTQDVQVDVDNDGTPETVTQIVYENDGVTPKTNAIMADVVIYDYVQTPDADKKYPLLARPTRGETANDLPGLVITAKRGDDQSNALVMLHNGASNDFLPEEDTETFINSDLEQTPTVYTLCGRLATTINSIRDFRSLAVGVESTSDAPCTLTFEGVELLGDSVSFYDAVEKKLTPLESGMQFEVSGQTQNRYYLVRSLDKKEAAEETHLQIFTEGLTAKVIASTAEPILSLRCFDTGGRLIHKANPQMPEYSFSLPIAGVYIIEAETENDHKVKKVMTK